MTISLTTRLAAGFILVMAGAHIGICVYLDHAFQQEFLAEDRRELAMHAAFVQQVLAEQPSFDSLRENPQRLLDAMATHPRLEFVLRDASGDTVVSSYGARSVAESILAQTRARTNSADFDDTISHLGRVWRPLVTSGFLGDTARTSIAAVLALDITEREHFANRYRLRLVMAAIVAIAIAGLVGFPLARSGLAPIDTMARRAREISSSRLDERLPVDNIPSELVVLAVAFNQALERLQDSFRRLSQFTSDVAHELRTPIGNVLGEAQVTLKRSRSPTEYCAALESIVEECEHVSDLIEGMLILARADNAQIGLDRRTIDGRSEVNLVVDYFSGVLAEKQIDLRLHGDADIWADPELLRRCVSNLLSNAVQHTPPGGAIDVSISVIADENVACIEISNTGPGVPVEAQDRIFDRFVRGKELRRDAARGAGLGLAIVRAIMQMHGGTVKVRQKGPRSSP
jgi:two-component system, OmpR family, heavy metal sensor histidine kinase CusS